MTTPAPTRVLIADDEPPAVARVRAMLEGRAEYQVVGVASDGAEAVDLLLREQPDLVFLDIKMPKLDGFEVLEALRALHATPPAIVFVTAFDDFAVKAFDVGALDYLLKPFDRERFDRALARTAARTAARAPEGTPRARGIPDGLIEYLRTLPHGRAFPERFLVRTGRRMHFVRTADIDWLDAQGNYVQLHAAGRTHLVRDTMKGIETKLDPAKFVRVHRSAIINVDRIAEIEPHVHGQYVITLRDGSRVTSSAAHDDALRALLK